MREWVRQYLDRTISRRTFLQRLAGCGFGAAASASILNALAPLTRADDRTPPAAGPAARRLRGNGGYLLVEQLRAAGVRYVFNTCSAYTHPIFDALLDDPDIVVIQAPQEGQAVSMAEGYALASGRVGVVVHGGVGFPNSLNNLYNARMDDAPVLVICQRPATFHPGRSPDGDVAADFLAPGAPFTRWRREVTRAADLAAEVRRALVLAVTPPGGPVALAIPTAALTEADVESDILDGDQFLNAPRILPDAARVEAFTSALLGAARPLLVAGNEVTRSGSHAALARLAERMAAPVVQGESLFDNFSNRHPLFIGSARVALMGDWKPDRVIRVGGPLPPYAAPPPGAEMLRIGSDAISQPGDRDVVAGLAESLDAVLARLPENPPGRAGRESVLHAFVSASRKVRERLVRRAMTRTPLSWERIGFDLESALEPDAVVVPELDQGGWADFAENAVLGALSFGPDAKRKIGRTMGSALGWGLGAALGVKLALPDRQVVALMGDGGFLFSQAETLWTVARYRVPLLVLVLNNRSYNGPRDRVLRSGGRQAQAGREMTSYLGDPDVDFTKIAAGFGVPGEIVSEPDALRPSLARAIERMRSGEPYLLDVLTERTGVGADSDWHPRFSLAALRQRAV